VPNTVDESRSSPRRDAAAVAVVVGPLALAAPGANAVPVAWATGFAGRSHGVASILVPVFTALLVVAGAVLTVAVTMSLLRRRRREDDEPEPQWQPPAMLARWARAIAATVAVLAAAVPFVALAVARPAVPRSAPSVAPSAVATPAASPRGQRHT
jgi:hypothetical protein